MKIPIFYFYSRKSNIQSVLVNFDPMGPNLQNGRVDGWVRCGVIDNHFYAIDTEHIHCAKNCQFQSRVKFDPNRLDVRVYICRL